MIQFERGLEPIDNRVDKLLELRRTGTSDAALLDEIYLTCLARYPTDAERSGLAGLLPPGSEDERQIIEDVLWGLMSSREFLFNH